MYIMSRHYQGVVDSRHTCGVYISRHADDGMIAKQVARLWAARKPGLRWVQVDGFQFLSFLFLAECFQVVLNVVSREMRAGDFSFTNSK